MEGQQEQGRNVRVELETMLLDMIAAADRVAGAPDPMDAVAQLAVDLHILHRRARGLEMRLINERASRVSINRPMVLTGELSA